MIASCHTHAACCLCVAWGLHALCFPLARVCVCEPLHCRVPGVNCLRALRAVSCVALAFITHGNVVQYASNAYLTTLLKNYTTQGLGSHVLWTIRYLVTAAGGDWGRMRQEVASTLCNKDSTVVHCLRADGAVAQAAALPVWLRPTVEALLQRWNAVASPAAKYTANSSPSASLHLRWWCLRLLKHAQAPFPQGIPVTIIKNKGGKKVQEVIVVHPKYFKLTPICKRATPFITLDNRCPAARAHRGPPDSPCRRGRVAQGRSGAQVQGPPRPRSPAAEARRQRRVRRGGSRHTSTPQPKRVGAAPRRRGPRVHSPRGGLRWLHDHPQRLLPWTHGATAPYVRS